LRKLIVEKKIFQILGTKLQKYSRYPDFGRSHEGNVLDVWIYSDHLKRKTWSEIWDTVKVLHTSLFYCHSKEWTCLYMYIYIYIYIHNYKRNIITFMGTTFSEMLAIDSSGSSYLLLSFCLHYVVFLGQSCIFCDKSFVKFCVCSSLVLLR
jgi:hypothetical protein